MSTISETIKRYQVIADRLDEKTKHLKTIDRLFFASKGNYNGVSHDDVLNAFAFVHEEIYRNTVDAECMRHEIQRMRKEEEETE